MEALSQRPSLTRPQGPTAAQEAKKISEFAVSPHVAGRPVHSMVIFTGCSISLGSFAPGENHGSAIRPVAFSGILILISVAVWPVTTHSRSFFSIGKINPWPRLLLSRFSPGYRDPTSPFFPVRGIDRAHARHSFLRPRGEKPIQESAGTITDIFI